MECSKDSETLQLKNSVITREFDISHGLRTTRLEFVPDGRNLVDPKHRNGLHGDIIEESSPCRESMIGIDGRVINLGHDSGFSVTKHEVVEGDDSDLTLKVTLSDGAGLMLRVFYQIYKYVELLRTWIYKSTFSTPATSMFYILKIDPAVMNGVDITKDPGLFEYYTASLACSGVSLKMSGMDVYHNEETTRRQGTDLLCVIAGLIPIFTSSCTFPNDRRSQFIRALSATGIAPSRTWALRPMGRK